MKFLVIIISLKETKKSWSDYTEMPFYAKMESKKIKGIRREMVFYTAKAIIMNFVKAMPKEKLNAKKV